MNAAGLFVDQTGTIRRPWRLAVFILATLATSLVLQGVAYWLVGPPPAATDPGTDPRFVIYASLSLVALVAGHALTFATVEPRSWELVGLDRGAARPRTLATGFVLGALAIGIPSLALLGAGWLAVGDAPDGSSLASAASQLASLAPAAFYEELLTRGYVFALIRDALGAPAALLITSVGFGLLHLANDGASALSVSLVTLAGVFLGAVLIVTRSLYAAGAAHLAWNWVLAGVLHTPVSGIAFAAPDYRVVDAGPDWATGGVWGPEGGAAAGVGMLAALTYLYTRHRRRGER